MKLYLGILLLFTSCLVALPTDAIRACGNVGTCKETANVDVEQDVMLGNLCEDDNCPCPCDDCPPDSDGCGHCHCPGCNGLSSCYTGFFKNSSTQIFPVPDWLYANRATHFFYSAPSTSAHLSALFQPPRL